MGNPVGGQVSYDLDLQNIMAVFSVLLLTFGVLATSTFANPTRPGTLAQGGPARSLDSIGGGNILRHLDSIGGGNILRQAPKSLDSIGGGHIIRQLDSIGGGNILRGASDYQPPKYHGYFDKRGYDPLRGMTFGVQKRNFDEIDRVGFNNFVKKNFDEIDRAGFNSFVKKNFDEIDRAGFNNFVKKNFDEIDRAGWNNF